MTFTLHYKHQSGPEKTRTFQDRTAAAVYGVAHYLVDNNYATPPTAGRIAGLFLADGEAVCDGIEFWADKDAEVAP